MSSKKLLTCFFILQAFFNFSILNNSAFAQEGESEDEGTTNIYLQRGNPAVQKADGVINNSEINNSNSTQTQSYAKKSNGKLAGVYEGTALACPYSFERDLVKGTRGEDVRLLQILLNSDKRTLVAVSGIGSPSNETSIFGEATNDALKRFQALFIEYVGVANGRFGPRTRTVMNAICNGENKSSPSQGKNLNYQNKDIYNNVSGVQKNASETGIATNTTNDKISPRVSLSANLNSVEKGSNFKVVANLSEEVNAFAADSVIVDGGVVKEVRKLSKTSYSVVITPNEDAKQVVVQVEADKLTDLAGNLNENASNEVSVKINTALAVASATSSTGIDAEISLNSILDKIVASAPNCTYNPSSGLLLTVDPAGKQINTTGCAQSNPQQPQLYDCYGQKIPTSQQCPYDPYRDAQQKQQQAREQAQQNAQNQGLGQILGSLLGKNGFGGQQGKSSGAGGGGGGGIFGGAAQTGPVAPSATGPAAQVAAAQNVLEACLKANNNDKAKCDAEVATKEKAEAAVKKAECLDKAGDDPEKKKACEEISSDTPTTGYVVSPDTEKSGLCEYIREAGSTKNAKDTTGVDVIGMIDIKGIEHTLMIAKENLTNQIDDSAVKSCTIYPPNKLKKLYTKGECCTITTCKGSGSKSKRQPKGVVYTFLPSSPNDRLKITEQECRTNTKPAQTHIDQPTISL